MAGKLEKLEARVLELYAHAHKDPARADWAGWLGKYHVPQVADYATELARRHGGNAQVARAAAAA